MSATVLSNGEKIGWMNVSMRVPLVCTNVWTNRIIVKQITKTSNFVFMKNVIILENILRKTGDDYRNRHILDYLVQYLYI